MKKNWSLGINVYVLDVKKIGLFNIKSYLIKIL